MLKLDENPPLIWAPDFAVYYHQEHWPEGKSISDFDGLWWVAHTKSRNEKALANDLVAKKISYFLPMTPKAKKLRNRTIKSLLPLFSGYMFFTGGENERLEVLKTNRVANIIEVKDQQQLLEQLLKIEQALHCNTPLASHRYIKTGQLCKVIAGPLMGMQGFVTSSKGVTKLVLQIDMLGQAASVEIDTDFIEPVEQ